MPEASEGDGYKFEVHGADGQLRLKADPFAFYAEVPPKTASRIYQLELRVGRRRLARAPPRGRAAEGAALDLRGARRVVAARPGLEGARRPARLLRRRPRLHARRAAAGMHHPFSGSWGYQVTGFYAPVSTLGRAGRLPCVRRRAAPGRDRRHPRLGAGALPARRVRAGALRRDRALRARGPAARVASRLGDADLQPRPERGAELPARERALLGARVPRRRAARRRRRVDALPRLLAQGRASGCRTPSAAARISRRSRSCAS